ncbi:MAG: ribosomal RNA small subunit methyltransferase A [Chloroflexi bacterium]|nr:ribosomal RNA small subunit methyltransferase A [Chloroflexota bacterium]
MPRRRLGQHFLRDSSVARRIVNAADISVGDTLVEIGPGNGALTHHIVDAASFSGSSVVLVEIDPKYAVMMEDKFASNPDVRVVCADARDIDFEDLPELSKGNPYKVVANLPYYAGTPIVRSFLEREHKPESMTVMLQREVARDMCATPGKMSLLSIAVQIYAEPKKLFDVSPVAFRPPPKVHSTVIKLVPRSEPLVALDKIDDLFKVARSAFLGRRKQLHNSLANGLGMTTDEVKEMTAAVGIDSERRPATLSIDEWIALTHHWRDAYRNEKTEIVAG